MRILTFALPLGIITVGITGIIVVLKWLDRSIPRVKSPFGARRRWELRHRYGPRITKDDVNNFLIDMWEAGDCLSELARTEPRVPAEPVEPPSAR